jgi:hypothetical protein
MPDPGSVQALPFLSRKKGAVVFVLFLSSLEAMENYLKTAGSGPFIAGVAVVMISSDDEE